MSLRASEFTDRGELDHSTTEPRRAEALYREILGKNNAWGDGTAELIGGTSEHASTEEKESELRHQEAALVDFLTSHYSISNAQGITDVIKLSRGNVSSIAKAKTAQLICTLLDCFDPFNPILVSQLDMHQYKPALALTDFSMTELKRLDNILVLTEDRLAVELKLSQMILDKVFHGVLNQGRGCLIIFEEPEADRAYGAAIDTLEQVGKVVDSLYAEIMFLA
ncbi:hypothetical protein ACG7TL_003271 [Trametes sanguinea]